MSRALRSGRARRAAVSGAATLAAGGLLTAMPGAASPVTHVLATVLINLTIPGSGNTITLTLGKAKLG